MTKSSLSTSRTGGRRTTVTSPIVRIRTDGRTNRGGKKKIKNGRKPPARLRGRQRTVSASSGVTTSWEATSVLSSLVESTRGFALGLFRRLCDSTDRNIVFSPLSISAAMAMTYIGARGNTRYQMEKVLRFHHFRNEADMHSTFSAVEDVISTSGKEAQYTFVQANRLFGQAGMSFRHDFLMDTSRHYHSSLATVEFSDEEMARLAINSWVAGKTGGKVNGVIPQGLLKPLTKLVLVNAVYFAGKWRTEFDPQVINMADFYVTPERTENVPMMQLSGEFNVTEDPNLDCAAVELPYSGNEIVMDIILPNQRDGLDRLQSQLTRRALNRIFRRYLPLEGSVFLPKFRLTEEFSLKAQLTAMGLDDLFSQNRADLSGMTAQPGMHVSDALHKAVIEVSQEEAEGATTLTAAVTARSRRGFEFRADHPFMFFIRDKRTGAVLFLGRLVDPRN
ncbi:PREDICTED: leukocyte elastase inhibitor-like [Branchiostoma belcheri]|uniref:Leukocyte elastase inhibitor-like n=1 Tax=Branchiostoma belcheri TaxID=7741 RepID=A0A6P5A1I7_BRABE|nr:PREDICTED: leukocyte elastase inhibitor-like [Branchiostoma belcheri]